MAPARKAIRVLRVTRDLRPREHAANSSCAPCFANELRSSAPMCVGKVMLEAQPSPGGSETREAPGHRCAPGPSAQFDPALRV